MEWIEVWRIFIWLGLLMWGIGLQKVMVSPGQNERLKALYGFTVFGYSLTWMAAWLMMKDLGYGLGSTWIGYSMLFGLVSITGSFLRAFSNSKGQLFNAMAAVGFTLSIASAVVQNEGISSPALALALAIVPGGLAAWFLPSESDENLSENLPESVVRGFKWMAWVEGATVLVLFLLYIPAKKLLDVNLDGGTGLIGWTHGVFVVVYVLSLTFTYRQLQWSFFQYFMGGFASFFPFGTIIFERKMFRKQA